MTGTMPFGKYAGRPLSALPDDYLAWVHRVARPTLKVATTAELKRRGLPLPTDDLEADADVVAVAHALVQTGFRALALRLHPDHGGDPAQFRALVASRDFLAGLLPAAERDTVAA